MLDAIMPTKDEYLEISLSVFQELGESFANFYNTISLLLVNTGDNDANFACWRVMTPSEVSIVQCRNQVPIHSIRLYNIFLLVNVHSSLPYHP